MEIWVSSISFAKPLSVWLGERMPPRLFGPAAAVVLVGGAVAGSPTLAWVPGAGATLILLLLQFRLWDDLADVPRDRVDHPERFLPRCASMLPFHVALGAAGIASVLAVSLLFGPYAAIGLIALNAAAALWYRRAPARRAGPFGALVVLAKYPAFSALIAPAPIDPLALAGACIAVYLVFCVHEWRTA
jgi:4-hydroxybenzoate polyprenyltransferase